MTEGHVSERGGGENVKGRASDKRGTRVYKKKKIGGGKTFGRAES